MACEVTRFGRFVVVDWLSIPTHDDVASLQKTFEQAYQVLGRPLIVVVQVRPEMDGVPATPVRDEMVAHMRRLLVTTCESMHAVVTRSGIAGSMQRTVMRGMALVVGVGGKLFVHESVAACITRLQALGAEPAELTRVEQALRRVGGARAAEN